MLPTVAPFPQVQPHHHRNQYHNSDAINSPYDLNNFAFPSHHHNDPNQNPLTSFSRTRLQYPHPVQRLGLRDSVGPKSNPDSAGEHVLRRKTPNGTLAAGYDGTPGDKAIQPPASKHVLVSSLEPGQLLPPQAGLQMENWPQQVFDQSSSFNHINFPPMYKSDLTRGNAGPSEPVQDVNGTGWVCSLNYGPGMDSVLNQSLPVQPSQRFLLQNGPYVPTVLPAALQPCVGPTASAGTGPYGPYWPDGVYIPYRPAALRDSRFNSPIPFAKPGLQFYDPSQPSVSWGTIPVGNHPDAGFVWNQPAPGMLNHDASLKSNFPPRHLGQRPIVPSQNHRILPYNTRQNDHGPGFSSQQPVSEPLAWSGTPVGSNFQNPSVPANSRATNAEFKEKVLTWAHGVYVDLLASIHQARRSSASNANSDGHPQRPLKPSIYPKPPRQPGLDFSQTTMPDFPRHNSYPSSQYDLHVHKNGLVNQRQSDSPNFEVKPHRRPSLAQLQHGASDTQMIDSLRHTGRFSSAVTPSRLSALSLNENSASANAVSALEMLSHLCMESRWEWIDGMLLGGCLAYGLGDYHKAIRWYSRIIARDSTYVYAAILLCDILIQVGMSKLYRTLQRPFWHSNVRTKH